jgi:hypothetical protein
VNDAVDRTLRIGWRLADTAMASNTTGINTELAMFAFVR